MKAEEKKGKGGSDADGIQWWWWWTITGTSQLGWGISAYRSGYSGDYRLMPVKAFGVAALFVGSAASASVAALQASGIHRVEDVVEVGANVRRMLGVPPRVRQQKQMIYEKGSS